MRERSLANWVHNQRLQYKADKLSAQRAKQLKSIPNWTWNNHESSWSTTFNSLKTLLSRKGPYPSQYAKSLRERKLAEWVKKQRRDYRNYNNTSLTENRISQLSTLPGWTFPKSSASWETFFAQAQKWSREHGILPSEKVHMRFNGRWLPIGSWLHEHNEDESTAKCTKKQSARLHNWKRSVAQNEDAKVDRTIRI